MTPSMKWLRTRRRHEAMQKLNDEGKCAFCGKGGDIAPPAPGSRNMFKMCEPCMDVRLERIAR